MNQPSKIVEPVKPKKWKPPLVVKCLWKDGMFAPVIHRMIWWMLDVGAPGQILLHGWQAACAREMRMSRITVARNIDKMVALGILKEGDTGYLINSDMFKRVGDANRVRKMKWNGRHF